MKLTLRQLSYFVAAAETGSITLASRQANISQPAISAAISHLERELGAQLFLRHHAQGLSITPAGRSLLREVMVLLKQADGLYSAAAALGQQPKGELSVGWFATLAPIVMPELLKSFVKTFPEARVRMRVADQATLLDNLRRAEIDVAITYDLQLASDIEFVLLSTLPPHVLVANDHALAGADRVTLEQLAPLPMVLLDLPLSREYFYSLFYSKKLEPTIAWASPHQDVVRAMVANGYGYALFNARPRNEAALDGRKLCRVRLAGDPQPMKVGLAFLPSLKRTRLVSEFANHCKQSLTSEHVPGMVLPKAYRRKGPR